MKRIQIQFLDDTKVVFYPNVGKIECGNKISNKFEARKEELTVQIEDPGRFGCAPRVCASFP